MAASGSGRLVSDAAMSSAILALGGFLGALGQGLGGQGLAGPFVSGGRTPDFDQLVGAVAAGAGLAVVAWWVLSMLCALVAAALERTGRQRGAGSLGLKRRSPSGMIRRAIDRARKTMSDKLRRPACRACWPNDPWLLGS